VNGGYMDMGPPDLASIHDPKPGPEKI